MTLVPIRNCAALGMCSCWFSPNRSAGAIWCQVVGRTCCSLMSPVLSVLGSPVHQGSLQSGSRGPGGQALSAFLTGLHDCLVLVTLAQLSSRDRRLNALPLRGAAPPRSKPASPPRWAETKKTIYKCWTNKATIERHHTERS